MTPADDIVLAVHVRPPAPIRTPEEYEEFPWLEALDEQIQRIVNERKEAA